MQSCPEVHEHGVMMWSVENALLMPTLGNGGRCIKLCDLCQALTHPEGASADCGMRTTPNSVYLRTLTWKSGGSFPHLQFSTDADDCRGQLGDAAMQERAAGAVGDGTS